MSDITPPPATAALQEEITKKIGWPLTKEAQSAMWAAMKRPGSKTIFLRDGFNAALRHDYLDLARAIIAIEIEQRAEQAVAAGETIKIRAPKRRMLKSAKYRNRPPEMEIVEIDITRGLLYHVMLGIPAPKVDLRQVMAKAAEALPPALLDASGNPAPRSEGP